jgi:hypothetical protein
MSFTEENTGPVVAKVVRGEAALCSFCLTFIWRLRIHKSFTIKRRLTDNFHPFLLD